MKKLRSTFMIEVIAYNEPGYQKLLSYKSWKVAMLNYTDELCIENIAYFEAHDETDEVFVLLEGNMILYYLIDDRVHLLPLEKNKIYNVKKGIYHTHVLSQDAKVLIVEEDNTSYDNSKRIYVDDDLRHQLDMLWEKARV